MTTDPRQLRVTWRAPYGVSWTPDGDTGMELHSHALRDGDDTWIIDPIDGSQLDGLLQELGGTRLHVVVLLDRHLRDAEAVARRHDATLHVVGGDTRRTLPEGSARIGDELPGSPFDVIDVRHTGKLWHECALWWPEHELLVIAESIGSSAAFRLGTDCALAVHPVLRLTPPRRQLARIAPAIVLVGHGPPVTEDATRHLREALAESRSRTPGFVGAAARSAVAAIRSR